MTINGLGSDIVDVGRFAKFKKTKNHHFLTNNFTKKELNYCFSHKKSDERLAGTFAAKEAVFKSLDEKKLLFTKIEIRHTQNGRPEVWIKNKRQESIIISISHTPSMALAIAIKQ